MALLIPEYLQTKKYAASRVRGLLMDMPFQPGVLASGDLKVTQRAAGANKTVDIAIGAGWAKGTFTSRQGFYHFYNDAIVNLTIPDNATGNPRLDQIVVRINDTTDGGGVADSATFEVIQGTPTAGATLDNRNGAAALPVSCLRIADVLAGAGFASITNANIRDRRPWATGAYKRIVRTAGDYSVVATSATEVDATNLKPRIECSGVPVRVTVRCRISHTTASATGLLTIAQDGAALEAATPAHFDIGGTSNRVGYANFSREIIPAAGSHTFSLMAHTGSGTFLLNASATQVLEFIVEELLRPNASND